MPRRIACAPARCEARGTSDMKRTWRIIRVVLLATSVTTSGSLRAVPMSEAKLLTTALARGSAATFMRAVSEVMFAAADRDAPSNATRIHDT